MNFTALQHSKRYHQLKKNTEFVEGHVKGA